MRPRLSPLLASLAQVKGDAGAGSGSSCTIAAAEVACGGLPVQNEDCTNACCRVSYAPEHYPWYIRPLDPPGSCSADMRIYRDSCTIDSKSCSSMPPVTFDLSAITGEMHAISLYLPLNYASPHLCAPPSTSLPSPMSAHAVSLPCKYPCNLP